MQLRELDHQEMLAVQSAQIGYFNNDKKPKFKKIFNKKKQENEIIRHYSSDNINNPVNNKEGMLDALEYFNRKEF